MRGCYHDINIPLPNTPISRSQDSPDFYSPHSLLQDLYPATEDYPSRPMSVFDNFEMNLIPPKDPRDKKRVEDALKKRFSQNAQYIRNINIAMFKKGGTNVDPTSFGNFTNPDEILEQPKIAIFDPPNSAYNPILNQKNNREYYTPNNNSSNKSNSAINYIKDIEKMPVLVGDVLANTSPTDIFEQTTGTNPILTWVMFLVILVVLAALIFINK